MQQQSARGWGQLEGAGLPGNPTFYGARGQDHPPGPVYPPMPRCFRAWIRGRRVNRFGVPTSPGDSASAMGIPCDRSGRKAPASLSGVASMSLRRRARATWSLGETGRQLCRRQHSRGFGIPPAASLDGASADRGRGWGAAAVADIGRRLDHPASAFPVHQHCRRPAVTVGGDGDGGLFVSEGKKPPCYITSTWSGSEYAGNCRRGVPTVAMVRARAGICTALPASPRAHARAVNIAER